jgi:hypothetical protein
MAARSAPATATYGETSMPVTNRTSAIALSAPSGSERARCSLPPSVERGRIPSANATAVGTCRSASAEISERDRSTPGHPCCSERMATSAPSVASPAASRLLQSLVPLRAAVVSARTTASGDTTPRSTRSSCVGRLTGYPTESA